MDVVGTYFYPFILIIIGGAIGGPLSVFGNKMWSKYQQRKIDAIPEGLWELVTQYECANWIESVDKRVERKNQIFAQMKTFLAHHPVEKQRLLDGGHLGRFIALAAAVTQYPERDDAGLILQVEAGRLPPGHAQHIFIEVIENLRSRFDLIPTGERESLRVWAQNMPNKDDSLRRRVSEMR